MHLMGDYSNKLFTQEHHIFGNTANRPLSEKYGLKVYLCLYHHTEGPEAVHKNKDNMEYLHRIGQKTFEEKYPDLKFRKIFGKNYIWQQEEKKEESAKGFYFLEEEE